MDTFAQLSSFDAGCLILILISALVAFVRGFIRELSSLLAFLLAIAAAWVAWSFARPFARVIIPQDWNPAVADIGVVVLAFLAIFITTAYVGSGLSKAVHQNTEIGFLDRLIGLVYGAARGALVLVIGVVLLNLVTPADSVPRWIGDGRVYPYLVPAADWMRANVPGLTEEVRNALPEPTPPETQSTPQDTI
jgi:membrane protein required for colicin V production